MLVIVCGLPGVGKTTFAKKLAPLINAIILSTDKIRKELITSPTYEKEEYFEQLKSVSEIKKSF